MTHDFKNCQSFPFFLKNVLPEELNKSSAHEAGAVLPSIVRVPSAQPCRSGHAVCGSRCYHCGDLVDWIWEEGGMLQDKLRLPKQRALDVQRVDADGTPV